jgi:hypothetical protein
MDALEKLMARYRAAKGHNVKAAVLDRLTAVFLPDRRAVELVLKVIEGNRPEEGVARVVAMKQLWACDLTAAADRERVVAALARIARGARSSVERVHAISELSAFLYAEPVDSLFLQLLLDPNEPDSSRKAAIACLPNRHPTLDIIAACKRLRDDALLGSSARLRLKEWRVE